MESSALEITPYRVAHRAEWIELWNRCFAGRSGFEPLTRELFAQRIERRGAPAVAGREAFDGFHPGHLLIAERAGRMIGFAHGGLYPEDLLASWKPDARLFVAGYLAMIAVDEPERRRGVGRALLAALRGALEASAGTRLTHFADGRMFNPFYGNSRAPQPPLWGTTEGICVPAEDHATRAFLRASGHREAATATSLRVDLGARVAGESAPASPAVECVEDLDYRPILGTREGSCFPEPNFSRTWVLVEGDQQVAALIAYPFRARRTGLAERWGIFSLEVLPDRRGRGFGKMLLARALDALGDEGVREVESLTLPEESPAALPLYAAAGFRAIADWIVFE